MVFCIPNGNGLRLALPVFIVLALACSPSVRADTPAQVQKTIQAVCSHAAVSYERRDLSGFMAMYSPGFVTRNVTGRNVNFWQVQANIAGTFANERFLCTAQCTVSEVLVQGAMARTVLHWRYITRHPRSASSRAYTVLRDCMEQSVWKKSSRGWLEAAEDMTRDVVDYRR